MAAVSGILINRGLDPQGAGTRFTIADAGKA